MEIKVCPFCGTPVTSTTKFLDQVLIQCPNTNCIAHSIRSYYNTEAEAIAAWNMRSYTEPPVEVDKLVIVKSLHYFISVDGSEYFTLVVSDGTCYQFDKDSVKIGNVYSRSSSVVGGRDIRYYVENRAGRLKFINDVAVSFRIVN